MQTTIYWVKEYNQNRIGLMARPRGGDWLEDEISALKQAGVDMLVSLLEESEIKELELENEADYSKQAGIDFIHFPIADRSTPASTMAAKNLIERLRNLLSQKKRIVIHCRQGVGRSSMIAAAILIYEGLSTNDAFSIIERARGCPVPDTPEQRHWVERLRG
jgi:protein-tyrosine phosphatase